MIYEPRDLYSMYSTTLFKKLKEYEINLKCQMRMRQKEENSCTKIYKG